MKTLISKRLVLRPVLMTDIPDLSKMLGDPDMMKYLFGSKPLSERGAEEFIRSNFSFVEDEGPGMGTLVERRGGTIVGFAGLKLYTDLGSEDYELGFVISAEGQGYATEIGERQIEFGLDELKLRRVLALVHPENKKSLHILRDKLGMKMLRDIKSTQDRGPRHVLYVKRSDGTKGRV